MFNNLFGGLPGQAATASASASSSPQGHGKGVDSGDIAAPLPTAVTAAESAKQRIASALERTGDALTEFATDHVAKQRRGDDTPSSPAALNVGACVDASNGKSDAGGGAHGSGMDEKTKSTFSTSAAGVAVAETSGKITREGDAEGVNLTTTAATTGGSPSRFPFFDPKRQGGGIGIGGQGGPGVGLWGANVLEATRTALESTRQTWIQQQSALREQQQQNGGTGAGHHHHQQPLLRNFLSGRNLNWNQLQRDNKSRRDVNLPLDAEALRDAEVVYITDRLITMGHPSMQSATDGDITPQRKLAAVAQLLEKRHAGRFMVWNLSEVEYDYSILDDQVLAYQFPGSPSPPLGLLLKLIFSMESWLKADGRNVAVVHCLTGKGRTSTVLSCFLCWMGEAGFHDPVQALEYIAMCKRCGAEQLTIPSQRRYLSYFSNMLDGVRPHQPPLLLKRIILSEAPKFERAPPMRSRGGGGDDVRVGGQRQQQQQQQEQGCSPYVQIFKGGQLAFTAAASLSYGQDRDELPFCLPSDGSVSFPVESIVQGDILIRCRHLTQRGKRVSMFRAAFHTGYTPPKVLRLGKAQLDGACNDKRFPDDFFVDLVFDSCDAEEASRHLLPSLSSNLEGWDSGGGGSGSRGGDDKEEGKDDGGKNKDKGKELGQSAAPPPPPSTTPPASPSRTIQVIHNQAAARRARATVVDGTNASSSSLSSSSTGTAKAGVGPDVVNPRAAVTASTYDSMLHRDARFWNVIKARREANVHRAAEAAEAAGVQAEEAKNPDGDDETSKMKNTNKKNSTFAASGPTIGRRRDLSALRRLAAATAAAGGNGSSSSASGTSTCAVTGTGAGTVVGGRGRGSKNGNDADARGKAKEGNKGSGVGSATSSFQSFSIGGTFDFEFDDGNGADGGDEGKAAQKVEVDEMQRKESNERDELMEALMGIDDDDDVDVEDDHGRFGDTGGHSTDAVCDGSVRIENDPKVENIATLPSVAVAAGQQPTNISVEKDVAQGNGGEGTPRENNVLTKDSENEKIIERANDGSMDHDSQSREVGDDSVAAPLKPEKTLAEDRRECSIQPPLEEECEDEPILSAAAEFLESAVDDLDGVVVDGNAGGGGENDEYNFDDDDDDELEDLEKFLTSSGK